MLLTKSYPIERSPFYNCRRKSKVATLLKTRFSKIKRLISTNQYTERYEKQEQKLRLIEDPNFHLKKVQKLLRKILARIETPDWLISGVKGRSIVDNAKVHQYSNYILKVDIKGFYQNCQREYIFRFFRRILRCSEDISWILTDLVTYNNHLPTGSPTSKLIAFLTYRKTFEKIYLLAKNNKLRMTLYVDDIVFSGENPIPRNFPYFVNRELEKVGLDLKMNKSKFYFKKDFKVVTGVAISPDGNLRVPNKRRKKIKALLGKNSCIDMDSKTKLRLKGSIISARQIEPNIFPGILNLASN